MANGSRSNVVGLSIVKMKMFAGVGWTLGDVSHVPSLRKNFISLSRLNILGYRFSSRYGFVEVGKYSSVVYLQLSLMIR